MSTVQTKPVVKHEVFVEDQLARMRGRIRALDAGRAVLWFFVVTFAYALFAAGLDRLLDLPTGVRIAGFLAYAVAAVYLAGSLVLSLYRRINPYYAARMLEDTLPDAKNSVVNWLDLRDEKLPPVILSALGNRAARDLRKADPEQAVNVGPTWILAGVLAGLVLGILILFVASPRQFMSLMGRAFAPFQEVGIATRTTITLIEPAGGNATVSPNRSLTFRAAIDGRVPAINQEGAPRLHFRYNQGDEFAGVPMEQDREGNYVSTLAADQLLSGGLWYKITANDAETPEYQIRVVPTPQVREFVAAYRYRPYLRIGEHSRAYSPALFTGLKAPRGTEVGLVIHANGPIREGSLRVQWSEGKKEVVDLPGEVLTDDPEAMRFPKLLLDRNGFFNVLFVSKQGERNIDRSAHKIEIIPDLAPGVELKKPEKDAYPANGTVPLDGSARDDFGIKSMTLRLQAHDNGVIHPLEAKPYRPGKSFQLVNGKYPDFLEYKDFFALDKVKTAKGAPFALKKGMAVELWLEAVDNSDYPDAKGHVGKSVAHKILIDEPEKNAKKNEKEQQQAEQVAKEHQKNQDQDLDRKNKAAKDEEQQANNQKSPEDKAQEKNRKDLDNQAQKLKDQLNKQDPKQDSKQDSKNDKGEAKGTDGPQSDTKKGEKGDNNEAAAKDSKNEKGPDKAGEQKDAGKNDGKDGNDKKPGQARDDGGKDDPKNPKGNNAEAQAKGPGDKSDAGPKGTADKNEPKSADKGEDKSAAKQSPEKSTGAAKEQGKNEKKGDNPGQAKQENPKEKNDPQAKGNDKQAGKEQPGSQAKDDKSGSGGQKTAQDKSEPKKGAGDQAQAKDQGKDNGKGEQQANAKENGKDSPKGSQGSAKSEDKKDPPSTAKDSPKSGGDKSAAAKAGGDSGKGGGDKSQAKQSNPDDAKRSAQAKGDPDAEKSGQREPNLDDVKNAANDLNKQKDPAAQDKAERDLDRIRQNARDPKVRNAADDALQQANRNPARAKKGTGEGEEHQAQAVPKGEGEKGGQTIKGGQVKGDIPTEQPSTGKGEPDKQQDKDTAQSETKGGGKAGDFGGQRGLGDDHKPQAADEDAGKRGGNLTLEDMKDMIRKTGPAQRKQAGVSDADWQKFLKDVQAYEQSLQKQRAQAKLDKTRGATSKLKGSGPFQVGSGRNDPVDPLQGGRFLPPPEFRQAHREFTRGSPASSDKKK